MKKKIKTDGLLDMIESWVDGTGNAEIDNIYLVEQAAKIAYSWKSGRKLNDDDWCLLQFIISFAEDSAESFK